MQGNETLSGHEIAMTGCCGCSKQQNPRPVSNKIRSTICQNTIYKDRTDQALVTFNFTSISIMNPEDYYQGFTQTVSTDTASSVMVDDRGSSGNIIASATNNQSKVNYNHNKQSGILWSRLNDSAKAAWIKLVERSQGKGIIDKSGIRNNPLPQSAWTDHDYLIKYDMPEGYLLLNRSFIPHTSDKSNGLRREAIDNLPKGSSNQEIADMEQLLDGIRKTIVDLADSKLEVMLTGAFKGKNVTFGGRPVLNTKEALKSWKMEEMTKEKCAIYFEVLYLTFEKDESLDRMEFDILNDLGIWFSSDVPNLDVSGKRHKKKATCIRHLLRNRYRDCYRVRYQNKQIYSHGVSLTISMKGG